MVTNVLEKPISFQKRTAMATESEPQECIVEQRNKTDENGNSRVKLVEMEDNVNGTEMKSTPPVHYKANKGGKDQVERHKEVTNEDDILVICDWRFGVDMIESVA